MMTQFSLYSDWYVNYKKNEMLTLWNSFTTLFPPNSDHEIKIYTEIQLVISLNLKLFLASLFHRGDWAVPRMTSKRRRMLGIQLYCFRTHAYICMNYKEMRLHLLQLPGWTVRRDLSSNAKSLSLHGSKWNICFVRHLECLRIWL